MHAMIALIDGFCRLKAAHSLSQGVVDGLVAMVEQLGGWVLMATHVQVQFVPHFRRGCVPPCRANQSAGSHVFQLIRILWHCSAAIATAL